MASKAILVVVALGIVPGMTASAATHHNFWTLGAAMKLAVFAPQAATFGSKIYVFGGYDGTDLTAETQIYTPATDTWSLGAPMPVALDGGVAVAAGKKIYVIGGATSSGYTNTVFQYSPATDTWMRRADMPVSRGSVGGAVIGNLIYVVGGNSPTQNRLTNLESYNPFTDSWTELPPMIVGRSELSVGAVAGKNLIALGGVASCNCATGDNEGYNKVSAAWTEIAKEPTELSQSCSAVIDGTMYVMGGWTGYSALYVAQIYTPATNTWKYDAFMPVPTTYASGVSYDGKVYCFGGASRQTTPTTPYNSVQIYTP